MKHLLVFRFSAMGDVAMVVPVLQQLRNTYPDLQITVVSKPFFRPILESVEGVNFVEIDTKGKHKGFVGLCKLFQTLIKLKPDAVADFHNVLRTKILRTFFAIYGVKVAFTDKGRKEKKQLTRSENKVFKQLKTMHQRHIDTLRNLGLEIQLGKHSVVPKKTETPLIQNIFGVKKNHWIGIAPFAQYVTKTYPCEYMCEVIRVLSDKNVNIFLFGSNQESDKLEYLRQGRDNVHIVCKQLTFIQELQLIQQLDLMLSMDSGNAHLAAMFGIPTITIWGQTHPFAGFAPFGQPMDYCLTPDVKKYKLIPTSIYGNKNIKSCARVMYDIVPEIVIRKVEKVLELE